MFLLKEVLYMPYFTIEKTFLFPSFDISFEERQKTKRVFGNFGEFRNRANNRGMHKEGLPRGKEAI